MNPELRALLEDIQSRLTALERVENVSFIKNIERRGVASIRAGTETVATTISQSVAEAGAASYSVAKVPDNKRQIILPDGSTEYIGTYNT